MENKELKKTAFWKNLLDWSLTIGSMLSGIYGKQLITTNKQGMTISNEMLGYLFEALGLILFGYAVYRFIYRINKMERYLITGMNIIKDNKRKILQTEVYSLIPYFENQYRILREELEKNKELYPNGIPINIEILKKHIKSEIMKIAQNTTGKEIEDAVELFYKPQEKKTI